MDVFHRGEETFNTFFKWNGFKRLFHGNLIISLSSSSTLIQIKRVISPWITHLLMTFFIINYSQKQRVFRQLIRHQSLNTLPLPPHLRFNLIQMHNSSQSLSRFFQDFFLLFARKKNSLRIYVNSDPHSWATNLVLHLPKERLPHKIHRSFLCSDLWRVNCEN